MINVTKAYLPSFNKYSTYIEDIFKRGVLTNNGPLVRELELRLKQYLDVEHLILVANGTIALDFAIRALDLKGEILTTPFSFVATTSAIVANKIRPVFVDINPDTFNMDPDGIESKISSETSGLLPVHVFGNPCEVEIFEEIANRRNLKIIYDAAHAFGVKYKNKSILNYGDVSTLSFHATKLFHTVEGGAIIVKDTKIEKKIRYLINFGIENALSIPEFGMNGKMNEFQAAMGLSILDDIDEIIRKRKSIYEKYVKELNHLGKIQKINEDTMQNYHYFPIVLQSENQLKKIQEALNNVEIFPRRYFYPSLDTLAYIEPKQVMNKSRDISERILCLPMYSELTLSEQDLIIQKVLGAAND